ncbi:DegT/DnrJ/EryC1/StrS aminotransferase family protein [Candidatus Parcubacteria bacterium]|nr:MAG: DegT/DnrJ/EryC1/StrS aminotransferase family protein [Candidatus Parcubacteria bacterium]
MKTYNWPLMQSNFHSDDFEAIVRLLERPGVPGWNTDVRLTQGSEVKKFEDEWSKWLGVKHSVFVNSGSSANLLTMAALKEQKPKVEDCQYCGGRGVIATGPNDICDFDVCPQCHPSGKILVPVVTWVSDITSVLHANYSPVFVDIDPTTLGMCNQSVIKLIKKECPLAVFLTHCMGLNAIVDQDFYKLFFDKKILLIEDCCESVGTRTRWAGRKHKVGTFGLASNFSFYYAHHLTTIEGGMICTDDDMFAAVVRSLRGHGMRRESPAFNHLPKPEDLDPEFIFDYDGYNCRSTEINAVIGSSQLKRLDEGIEKRRENFKLFLENLDSSKYQTDFETEGSSPYGLILVLRNNDKTLRDSVCSYLQSQGIEYRRGVAGGGNQLRQPYLRRRYGTIYAEFPNAEHVHFNGFCIGNWPDLKHEDILRLCESLNKL